MYSVARLYTNIYRHHSSEQLLLPHALLELPCNVNRCYGKTRNRLQSYGLSGITQFLCLGQSASSVVVTVVLPAVGHTYAVSYAQIEFARATSAKLRERDKAASHS